mmetsp:Transcript_14984/g.25041  ORF Transcript_14984/g.25041 Transcript_14984/m.25041 type:complete len:759 (+) Transcript_14984:41-2317(+)
MFGWRSGSRKKQDDEVAQPIGCNDEKSRDYLEEVIEKDPDEHDTVSQGSKESSPAVNIQDGDEILFRGKKKSSKAGSHQVNVGAAFSQPKATSHGQEVAGPAGAAVVADTWSAAVGERPSSKMADRSIPLADADNARETSASAEAAEHHGAHSSKDETSAQEYATQQLAELELAEPECAQSAPMAAPTAAAVEAASALQQTPPGPASNPNAVLGNTMSAEPLRIAPANVSSIKKSGGGASMNLINVSVRHVPNVGLGIAVDSKNLIVELRGAAAEDGMLRIGDLIVAVDDQTVPLGTRLRDVLATSKVTSESETTSVFSVWRVKCSEQAKGISDDREERLTASRVAAAVARAADDATKRAEAAASAQLQKALEDARLEAEKMQAAAVQNALSKATTEVRARADITFEIRARAEIRAEMRKQLEEEHARALIAARPKTADAHTQTSLEGGTLEAALEALEANLKVQQAASLAQLQAKAVAEAIVSANNEVASWSQQAALQAAISEVKVQQVEAVAEAVKATKTAAFAAAAAEQQAAIEARLVNVRIEHAKELAAAVSAAREAAQQEAAIERDATVVQAFRAIESKVACEVQAAVETAEAEASVRQVAAIAQAEETAKAAATELAAKTTKKTIERLETAHARALVDAFQRAEQAERAKCDSRISNAIAQIEARVKKEQAEAAQEHSEKLKAQAEMLKRQAQQACADALAEAEKAYNEQLDALRADFAADKLQAVQSAVRASRITGLPVHQPVGKRSGAMD